MCRTAASANPNSMAAELPPDPSTPTTTGPGRSPGDPDEQPRPGAGFTAAIADATDPRIAPATPGRVLRPDHGEGRAPGFVPKCIDRCFPDQSGRDLEMGMIATSAVDYPVEQDGRLGAKQVVHIVLNRLPQLGKRVSVHDAKFGRVAFGLSCRPAHCVLRPGRRREAERRPDHAPRNGEHRASHGPFHTWDDGCRPNIFGGGTVTRWCSSDGAASEGGQPVCLFCRRDAHRKRGVPSSRRQKQFWRTSFMPHLDHEPDAPIRSVPGPGTGHTFLMSCQDTISAQMTNRSKAMMMTAHSG